MNERANVNEILQQYFAVSADITSYHFFLYEHNQNQVVSCSRVVPDGFIDDALDTTFSTTHNITACTEELVQAHFGADTIVQIVAENVAGVVRPYGAFPGKKALITDPKGLTALCRLAITAAAGALFQERLRNENEQIILSVGEGFLAVDGQRRVVFMNPMAMELLGLIEVHPVGKLLQELVPSLPLDKYWEQLTVQGKNVIREEFSLTGAMVRDLGVSLMKLIDLSGKPAGVIVSLHDLQVEKDMERMREEFITTVSHEFRTPLTSIKSFSELLLEYDDEDEATRKEFLGIINKESDTLNRLVEDALAISRLEGNSVEWRKERLNLEELLRDAAAEIKDNFAARNIVYQPMWEAGVIEIDADRLELSRALSKLLDNCCKFADEESTVKVTAVREEGVFVLRFENNGERVAEGNEELIFKKFKQGDDFLQNKAEGTGLGLPICRKIIEYHNGTVELEQSSAGCTVFAVRFPASAIL